MIDSMGVYKTSFVSPFVVLPHERLKLQTGGGKGGEPEFK
jgi:hypothetical protein